MARINRRFKRTGVKSESALHIALKNIYTSYSGNIEKKIDGFICDGFLDDDTIIEVQLNSFAPLKRKAEKLCAARKLIIVHPVILKKEIYTFNEQGDALSRRKSPRKGTEWDLFSALVYAPCLPLIPNVSVDLALVDVIETRVRDGKGSWRRGGVSITGKSLSAWHGSARFESPDDYRRFIPFAPGEQWTAACLAKKAGIRAALAHKTLYVLSRLGIVKEAGKTGRSRLWEFV